MRYILEGGTIVNSSGSSETDCLVSDGKFQQFGSFRKSNKKALRIDVSDYLILPGMVEVNASFPRTVQGYTPNKNPKPHWDWMAIHGITTYAATVTITNPLQIERQFSKESLYHRNSPLDYIFMVQWEDSLFSRQKLNYLYNQGVKQFLFPDLEGLARANLARWADWIKEFNCFAWFFLYPRDEIVSNRRKMNRSIGFHYPKKHTREWEAFSKKQELEWLYKWLTPLADSGIPFGIAGVTSKKSMDYIKHFSKLRNRYIPVEIYLPHLYYEGRSFKTNKVLPPIREKGEKDALRQRLMDDEETIPASLTDPIANDSRFCLNPAFYSRFGLPGRLSPIGWAVDKSLNSLQDWSRLVNKTACLPAKLTGLYPQKGTISLNSDADFLLFHKEKWLTDQDQKAYRKDKTSCPDFVFSKGKLVAMQGNSCYGRTRNGTYIHHTALHHRNFSSLPSYIL